MAKEELIDKFLFYLRADQVEVDKREYIFHPTRKWRLDFAWPEHMLAVEVEGGIWTGGGHTRGSGFLRDCEKYNAAALMGWTVLRYPVNMIDSGQASLQVKEALMMAKGEITYAQFS